MIDSDGEFEFELTASLRRWQKQIAAPVIELQRQVAGPALALAELQRQIAAPVIELQRQVAGAALALAELQREMGLQRQMVASVLAQLATLAERQHWQVAEVATRSDQQAALKSADAVWVVQICAFVLLVEVLLIGWSLAAAVGPDARAKYLEIIGLIMAALEVSGGIKGKRGRDS